MIPIMSQRHFLHFILLVFKVLYFIGSCYSYNLKNGGSVSNFSYSRIDLEPYQWRYIRVDLPQWFSSMAISIESNVDPNPRKSEKVEKSRLPVICLGDGSLPIPDVNNITVFEPPSNLSFGNMQDLQKTEFCYPMQKNIYLKLTNEQILPGVWNFGFFNGIGPTRTQAKMIDRGKAYSLGVNISIEKCTSLALGGPSCDRKINHLTCANKHFRTKNISDSLLTEKLSNVISCSDSEGKKCLINGETKIYALDIQEVTEKLTMELNNVTFRGRKVHLKYSARYGAMPSAYLYDFSANFSGNPLVIPFPKVGSWYFSFELVNSSNKDDRVRDEKKSSICFLFNWLVFQCPQGKAGSNCSSGIYMLQRIPKKNTSTSFEANYNPVMGSLSSYLAEFPLDPFSTNKNSAFVWTYFVLNIPRNDSGGNLHVKLTLGGSKINYQLYARYKGLPSIDSWDYFYANSTSNSNGSPFFKVYDSREEVVSFYILYVKEGTWYIGLRRLNPVEIISEYQTMASISMERCPQSCASYGTCKWSHDVGESLQYNYCSCDKDHGGFDCGVTIVSRLGHIWRSVFLIGSNTAAILPALWCLRHKAYAEWVVLMSSGVSSGIYHACDSGNPCLLSADVLQFMDFWLSYMAVVSTFLYLTNLGESSKRAVNMGLAIITALMARNGFTKAWNMAIIIVIGVSGLLLGLLIEFGFEFRSYSFSSEVHIGIINWWQAVKVWLGNHVKTFVKYFRWGILTVAFISLTMAKLCWDYETPENYWILHSLWHITIYTSSFLFLCSKAMPVDNELAQQHSTPREG